MKKVGILVLMFCLVIGHVGFAADQPPEPGENQQNVARASNQVRLFTLPFEDTKLERIKDFEYREEDGKDLLYLLGCPSSVSTDGSKQVVFTFTGDVEKNPEFPEPENRIRRQIEFDGGNAYSLEKDDEYGCPDRLRVYNLNLNADLGSPGVFNANYSDGFIANYSEGFIVSGNTIAFHHSYSGSNYDDEPNFYIGTLDSFTASGATAEIRSTTGQVKAFDLNPSGTELIYATHECTSETNDPKFVIRAVAVTGEFISEFTFDPAVSMESSLRKEAGLGKISSLYATKQYIVVLSRYEYAEKAVIQRFTYDGGLIDSVETNYQVREIAEGPKDSTIYVERRFEDDGSCGLLEVVQVKWKTVTESAGRPRSVISERSFGGQTVATFRDHGFGLLRVEDPETGELHYQAPLKSDKPSVKLQIPFFDINAKIAAGAQSLMINYQDQMIQIPMSVFDCADLFAAMPCQDDATIEIQLSVDEEGKVTVTIQLFVVEQVNEMTKVVHRKTIQ